MPWSSWVNAEIYDRFVRERGIYAWLNRRLVELARIGKARRVLDVGCGTGATALACLAAMRPEAELVGIDSSEPMVGVARSNVLDPRARFEVLAAADSDRLEGDFDAVVCNAAFWQFPTMEPVFRALALRTGGGARFVFNVPAERVQGQRVSVHPFQVGLMREIEFELDHKFEATPTTMVPEFVGRSAVDHGFELREVLRLEYEALQGELIELMSIPAMIEPLTSAWTPERRDALLRRVRERSDPSLPVTVPWVYFVLERVVQGRSGDR